MTLVFDLSERFEAAASLWADERFQGPDEALEEKVEQALLEIEHLASGATDVDFELEEGTVHHEPTDDLAAFLAEQADRTGLDEAAVLKLYVDLFAGAFLDRGVAQLDG